jgi:hypothetical protein
MFAVDMGIVFQTIHVSVIKQQPLDIGMVIYHALNALQITLALPVIKNGATHKLHATAEECALVIIHAIALMIQNVDSSMAHSVSDVLRITLVLLVIYAVRLCRIVMAMAIARMTVHAHALMMMREGISQDLHVSNAFQGGMVPAVLPTCQHNPLSEILGID